MSSVATNIVPAERIQSRIVVLRGQRVLLDRDLAAIYEVPTKQLNQAVKRNLDKFPDDFVFQLTRDEALTLQIEASSSFDNQRVESNRSQTVTGSSKHRGKQHLPYAFTEHGAILAANILKSPVATQMSIAVVRAFVGLRQLMVNHKALSAKLAELDARVGAHDEQLAAIVEAIRQLAEPVPAKANSRKIGFHSGNR